MSPENPSAKEIAELQKVVARLVIEQKRQAVRVKRLEEKNAELRHTVSELRSSMQRALSRL